jgi:rubrerythrin
MQNHGKECTGMNETQLTEILKGLQTAMRAEFEGYHFYMLAAENTADPRGRDAFKQLATDEFDHMNILQAQFDSISKNQQPNPELRLKQVPPFPQSNPIFSEDIKTRLKEAHYEMTVLSVGIQLELNAMQQYRDLAAKAADKTVSRFYMELVEWEDSHYQMLLAQQDALKEEYWSANHFHPY